MVVPAKYSNYSNVLSTKNIAELPKHIGIKNHAIKLKEDKQTLFDLYYSVEPVKLEIFKI